MLVITLLMSSLFSLTVGHSVFVSYDGTNNHPCSKATPCLTVDFAIPELYYSTDEVNTIYINGDTPNNTPYMVGSVILSVPFLLRPLENNKPPVLQCKSVHKTNFDLFYFRQETNISGNGSAPLVAVNVEFRDVSLHGCSIHSSGIPLTFVNTSLTTSIINIVTFKDISLTVNHSSLTNTSISIHELFQSPITPGRHVYNDTAALHTVTIKMSHVTMIGEHSQMLCNLSDSSRDVKISLTDTTFTGFIVPVYFISGRELVIHMQRFQFLSANTTGKCLEIDSMNSSRLNVSITNSTFAYNTCSLGGALALHYTQQWQGHLNIAHSTFSHNHGNGCGSALKVHSTSTMPYYTKKVNIENSLFIGNTNSESAAGIYIEGSDVYISECQFTNNSVVTGTTIISTIEDRKGSGGAIYLASTAVSIIDRCYFHNNSANWFGGTLNSAGTLSLINSTFSNLRNNPIAALGDIMYLTGYTLFENIDIHVHSSYSNIAIIWYSSEVGELVGIDGGYITFTCPYGAQFHNETLMGMDQNYTTYRHLFYMCNPCMEGKYSLDQGFIHGTLSDENTTYSDDFQCHDCAYGGQCHMGHILAKSNFWGYVDKDEVVFHACPLGYCCPQDVCSNYTTCNYGREGRLCGRCQVGMSEDLYKPDCKPNAECQQSWYLVTDMCSAIVYTLLFMYQAEIGAFVLHTVLGLPESPTSLPSATAYTKSVFYFYQVVSLIVIESSKAELAIHFSMQPFISYLFSFRPIAAIFGVCPFPDLTPVKKVGLGLVPVFMTLMLLAFLFTCYKVYRCREKSQELAPLVCTSPTSSDTTPDFKVRLGMALINILLYGYMNLAMSTFQLLSCVSVDGDTVLYIEGNISCLTPWQYAVLALLIIHVAPFFLVVIYSRGLLESGLIGFRQFFVSYIFPLPMLVFWGVCWVRQKYKIAHRGIEDAELLTFDRSVRHRHERMKIAILSVIEEPYINTKEPEESVVYWEGILILRRLCLCVAATLLVNRLLSITFQTLLSLGFLIWHLIKKPFCSRSANNLETISLTALTVISLFHLIKATYFEMGERPYQVNQIQVYVGDWLEWVLVNALPLMIAVALVITLTLRLWRLLRRNCKRAPLRLFSTLSSSKISKY